MDILMLLDVRSLTAIMQQPNAADLLDAVVVRYKLVQQQRQQKCEEAAAALTAAAAAAAGENSAVPATDEPDDSFVSALLPPFTAADAAAVAQAAAELAAADAAATESEAAHLDADTTTTTAAAAAAAAETAADDSLVKAQLVPGKLAVVRLPGASSATLLPPSSVPDAAAVVQAVESAAADAATPVSAAAAAAAAAASRTATLVKPAAAAAANSPLAKLASAAAHEDSTDASLELPGFGVVRLLGAAASPDAAAHMRLRVTEALQARVGAAPRKLSKLLDVLMLFDVPSLTAILQQPNAADLLMTAADRYKLAGQHWQVQQRKQRERRHAIAAVAADDAAMAAAAACSDAVFIAASTALDPEQDVRIPGYGVVQLLPPPANKTEAMRMSFGFLRVLGSGELGKHISRDYRRGLTEKAAKLAVLMRLPKPGRDALLRQPNAAVLLDAVYAWYELPCSPLAQQQQEQLAQQQQERQQDHLAQQQQPKDADGAASAVEGEHDTPEYFSADESDEYLSADEDSEVCAACS
jgi:hypothetical protein